MGAAWGHGPSKSIGCLVVLLTLSLGACADRAAEKERRRRSLDAYLAGFDKLKVELQTKMTAALRAQHESRGGAEARAALAAENDAVLETMRGLTVRLKLLDAPNPDLHRLREAHIRLFEATTTAFDWAAKAFVAEDKEEQKRDFDKFEETLQGDAAKAAERAAAILKNYRRSLR